MKSLLNRSLSRFLVCTIIILILATPFFYLLTEYFYAEDLIHVTNNIRTGGPIPALDLKNDIMGGLMIQYGLIFFILSLSFIVTIRLVTKKLWRPFNDTLQKIERFNLEQSKIPTFIDTDINEFSKLNEAVMQLMQKDMESYKLQREFIENASHELQTPIAIFQGKLDLLLQEDLTERESEIVSDLYSVSSRLNRLNKNLLLLAKIDNKQYKRLENIDMILFLDKNLSVYRDLYGDCTVRLVNKNDSHMVVKANRFLLESLLNNLVTNAISYSPTDNKCIQVITQGNMLIVANPSDGKKLDEMKLFRRFHNSDSGGRGNGLGLSIVKAICDYHGWKVTYLFQDNVHYFYVAFG